MPINPIPIDPVIANILKIGSGFFWTFTYILIIRRGFIDKCCGMPLIALCANISWEFIFSFVFPHKLPQLYINYVWLFFDVGIFIQYLYFGRKFLASYLSKNLFYPTLFLTLVLSYFGIIAICYEFKDSNGIYAAFVQNLVMSVLFFSFLKRESCKGQSLYIALFKMIGTIFASLLFYLHYPNSYLLIFLFISIFIVDIIYTFLLYSKLKFLGTYPWKRI